MKFGHLLRGFTEAGSQDDGQAVNRDFLSYKKLKKLLKQAAVEYEEQQQLSAVDEAHAIPAARQPASSMTEAEREFITLLNQDLEKINSYFIEAEEDAVIKLQSLGEQLAAVPGEDADALRSAFVDFHGELVLLLHWSMVNYAGVAKILKKHDKLIGGVGKPLHPYLANVLQQPFTSTEGISRLVKEAEGHVQRLPGLARDGCNAANVGVAGPSITEEGVLVKRTRAALGMLTQLRETAHTPSTLLPVPVDEQPSAKKAKADEVKPTAECAAMGSLWNKVDKLES